MLVREEFTVGDLLRLFRSHEPPARKFVEAFLADPGRAAAWRSFEQDGDAPALERRIGVDPGMLKLVEGFYRDPGWRALVAASRSPVAPSAAAGASGAAAPVALTPGEAAKTYVRLEAPPVVSRTRDARPYATAELRRGAPWSREGGTAGTQESKAGKAGDDDCTAARYCSKGLLMEGGGPRAGGGAPPGQAEAEGKAKDETRLRAIYEELLRQGQPATRETGENAIRIMEAERNR